MLQTPPPVRLRPAPGRPARPRAGGVRRRRAERAAGDHRHLLHRARPGAGRHPVLPVRRGEPRPLDDVLELSRAMAYKNALAGLDHGGGKAVIIGDPAVDKSEALLLAYGRFVEGLGGRYVTACDVGTYVADMDVVAAGDPVRDGAVPRATVARATRRCSRRTACSRACGPAPSTCGARPRSPAGRSGVAGVGKVGRHLVGHLRRGRRDRGGHRRVRGGGGRGARGAPAVQVVADTDALVRGRPRRLLAVRARATRSPTRWWPRCRPRLVCGGANNQLAHPGVEDAAGRARHPLRPGLLRQRRRRDPGGRRAARLLLRARPGQDGGDLRHDAPGCWPPRPTRASRRPRRRPAGRAADGRGRTAAGARPTTLIRRAVGRSVRDGRNSRAGMYRWRLRRDTEPGAAMRWPPR